ncbi:delta-60 repeat domain-containing protein [Dokdonella soli]|uniref:delta-60 repeat domain-containing protein n=1 Tax=Dokdonella soli TaxID=529810 RepID=UPI003613B262
MLVCAWLFGLAIAPAFAQKVNDGFDPNADNAVWALAVQADGKLVAAGDFINIAGQSRPHLARLWPDGSLDFTLANPVVNGTVYALALQTDGKILIGGSFTKVGTYARNNIARLNPDGSVDAAFNPNANNVVRALALQTDGKLVLGGDFTSIDGGTGGTTRNHVARLNPDGSLDMTFVDPNADSTVLALTLQADGKIVAGGYFTFVGGFHPRLVRLNADGSPDSTFGAYANDVVYALAQQADGKLLVGGKFTSVRGQPRNCVARLNLDSTVDSTFNPNVSGGSMSGPAVHALALQANGQLVLGGDFTLIDGGTGGSIRNNVARLHADGSLETGFNPSANYAVIALAQQADNKLMLGGFFDAIGGTPRNRIARLNADGSTETDFDPNANGNVYALMQQADGGLVLGGDFTLIDGGTGGTTRNYIARLNPDGSLDTTFQPQVNGHVAALAQQADGKILIGGSFTQVGACACNRIARLNTDGSVDIGFNPGAGGADSDVYALALQPDGKLVLGGNFTTIGGTLRHHIARLNTDGGLDIAFVNPGVGGVFDSVLALALQTDGKIVAGGNFTQVGAYTRNRIARLNPDGSLDTAFDPNANGPVFALALQADGKMVLGGNFTSIDGGTGGSTRNRIARLNADGNLDIAFHPDADKAVYALALQADGKVALGGSFAVVSGAARSSIARLSADGNLDATFPDLQANNSVEALALQADGKLVIGGAFTKFNVIIVNGHYIYTARNHIARLSQREAALQSLTLSGNTVTWLRSGTSPELALPPDLLCSSKSSFCAWLGTVSRIAGGWRYSGLLLPAVGNTFYLRAQGQLSSGDGNGSQGLIESTRQAYNSGDLIFADGFEPYGI